jgi:hypothetical protein
VGPHPNTVVVLTGGLLAGELTVEEVVVGIILLDTEGFTCWKADFTFSSEVGVNVGLVLELSNVISLVASARLAVLLNKGGDRDVVVAGCEGECGETPTGLSVDEQGPLTRAAGSAGVGG